MVKKSIDCSSRWLTLIISNHMTSNSHPNSSCRGSHNLFWYPQELHTMVHIHNVKAKNTHSHKIKVNESLKFFPAWKIFSKVINELLCMNIFYIIIKNMSLKHSFPSFLEVTISVKEWTIKMWKYIII